jgi:hypothetical protein
LKTSRKGWKTLTVHRQLIDQEFDRKAAVDWRDKISNAWILNWPDEAFGDFLKFCHYF